MSGSLQPEPFKFGAMGPNDHENAWLIDCTAWATARGVTIVSVGAPTVRRKDGRDLGEGDVAITNVAVVAETTTRNGLTVAPGYGFIFTAITNGNTARYELGFPITDTDSSVVTRWGELPVISTPG